MKSILGTLTLAALLLTGGPATRPTPPLSAESFAFRKQRLTRMLDGDAPMRPAERVSAYAKYDFGTLWLGGNDERVFGFVGPGYQRLQVKFLTIRKSATRPTRYNVTGKTRVRGVVRAFRGSIRLEHVRDAPGHRLPAPYEDFRMILASGVAVGSYELAEDARQPGAGVFRGVLATYWLLDEKRRLRHDQVLDEEFNYSNDQFVGTWTSYTTPTPLRCNWGYGRIPNAGDFYMGVNGLLPNPKYRANGWQNFVAMYNPNYTINTKATQQEQAYWWK